ncbi:MFS transporter [Cyanobium sp. HWJ4-Hawea]|nr:MFS transporter [Cyanobium sp. HWJ4-Hawea]MCP9807972.1 MFS transporter [Cyanobium sp. HWJ4-Hawea]
MGSQTSLYALGLWLFQRQQHLSDFAAVAVVMLLSKLIALPQIGHGLRLLPRRRLMLVANGLAGLVTLSLGAGLQALPAGQDVLRLPVLACMALVAMAEAALVVSFATAIPLLVSESQLGQANGLLASSDGAIAMAAPALGALLAATWGLPGVLLVDGSTSLLAAICTLAARWPAYALQPAQTNRNKSSNQLEPQTLLGLRQSMKQLWRSPQWRQLLFLQALVAASLAAVEVLFPAWLAAATGPGFLSLAMAFGAVGYGLGLRQWQSVEPKRWLLVVKRGLLLQGVLLTGAGLQIFQDLKPVLLMAVLVFASAVPLVLSGLQSLWSSSIPIADQPKLFRARYGLDWLMRLLALLVVSGLVDQLITPAVFSWKISWLLPPAVMEALGHGPGRPIAMTLGLTGWALLIPLWGQWRLSAQTIR